MCASCTWRDIAPRCWANPEKGAERRSLDAASGDAYDPPVATEFPRCSVCRGDIEPGTAAVVHPDGRVHHVDCQEAVIPAASDCDPGELVRKRLGTGALPSGNPLTVWGGTSAGSVCGGCALRILPGQIEYELNFANAVLFRLHRSCYVIWERERRAPPREISGGSVAAFLV